MQSGGSQTGCLTKPSNILPGRRVMRVKVDGGFSWETGQRLRGPHSFSFNSVLTYTRVHTRLTFSSYISLSLRVKELFLSLLTTPYVTLWGWTPKTEEREGRGECTNPLFGLQLCRNTVKSRFIVIETVTKTRYENTIVTSQRSRFQRLT